MLCQLLYSKESQPHVYIYTLFLGFLSHLDHHRILNRVLCAMQQIHISYLFYIQYQQCSLNLICISEISKLIVYLTKMLCYFSLELLFKLQFRGVKTIFIYYIHYIIIYSHIHLYILVNIFTIFIFIIPLTNNNKLSDLKIHTFIILFCRSQGQHSSHWAKIKM